MVRPYVEIKEKKRINIKTGFIILLLLSTILFGLLYAGTKHDTFVLNHMESWLLEGSTNELKVNNLLFQYNGEENCLSGGTLYYLGKATGVKGYSYQVILEDINGIKEPITLISNMVTSDMAALPEEISMGSIEGPAQKLAYEGFAEKYKVKLEFKLITATETLEQEVYLKITELNNEFFKN